MSQATPPPTTNGIPRVWGDQTIPLLWQGYGYLSHRLRQMASTAFEGRLLGQRTVFMSGSEAAGLFYDNERFVRAGAVPGLIRLTLFGKHTVQGLDGPAHRHRKAIFAPLTDPQRVRRLVDLVSEEWRRAAAGWSRRGNIRLFDEATQVLGRAALRWSGIGLPENGASERITDMRALVEYFGAVGPGQLRGRLARLRCNAWMARYITAVRDGRLPAPPDSILTIIATHRDSEGRILDVRTASEEMLNVVRPIIANAWWITFAAHALHQHPQWRQRLPNADDETTRAFTDEIRRTYPFAPMMAARVRHGFTWHHHYFRPGQRVILDLYGTNHDPWAWSNSRRFDPERFLDHSKTPFNFVPQGGGDTWQGHRCPGEDITSAIMALAVSDLARRGYRLPKQDLTISYRRFPTNVRSGVLMSEVEPLVSVGQSALDKRLARRRLQPDSRRGQ